MNPELENVIRKVRKLIAVGDKNRNNSETEATTAMEMASKLMTEWNLSIDDVKVVEMKAEGAVDTKADIVSYCVPWERMLAQAVAKLFGTKAYRRYLPRLYCMSFIGVGGDAQVSAAAYNELHAQLVEIGKNSPFRGTEQRTFLYGVTIRLFERAKALAREAEKEQETKGVCKDLVLVKSAIISDYATNVAKLRNRAGGARLGGTNYAFNHGKIVGNTVSLPSRNQIT